MTTPDKDMVTLDDGSIWKYTNAKSPFPWKSVNSNIPLSGMHPWRFISNLQPLNAHEYRGIANAMDGAKANQNG